MIDIITNCPSLLAEGYSTYCLKARKLLFDGQKVNCALDFNIDEFKSSSELTKAMHRISVSVWRVDMERFFDLVVFNYIYANGDDHMKNFSLVLQGEDYRLAPAYDLLNTSVHVNGDDFGLDGGLSPNIQKSDVYDNTGHPCRLDFERFAARIGLIHSRASKILDRYMKLPQITVELVKRSFLSDKAKRHYLRIVNERISRFVRESE